MTEREALMLALEALLHAYPEDEAHPKTLEAITAIKEALAQPQRTWVGLTDEEFQYCVELKNPESIAEEVEAKLKEKNTP